MADLKETREAARPSRPRDPAPVPGVLLVATAGQPTLSASSISDSTLTLGRASSALLIDDELTSRQHTEIRSVGTRWCVRDLESRNGTYVDGVLTDQLRNVQARVVRIGQSLFVLVADVTPYLGKTLLEDDGRVMGPALQQVYNKIQRFGQIGDTLHIMGPSGSGKELAARAFHRHGASLNGPFIAVNCAAIPDGVAERLLFGSVRGAFSGAEDAEGYLQAAHQGTLFLDELAELDLKVQAKLLRVLETREVTRLGSSKPTRVELQVVSATHSNLRKAVAEGGFREDLYFRIGRPALSLPPLQDRPEEIPWLIDRTLARLDDQLVADVTLMEACLLRPWPGNVRELSAEITRAAHQALVEDRTEVTAQDLDELAGRPWTEPDGESSPTAPDQALVKDVLAKEKGNVSAAARRLGLHRNQLRRLMTKWKLDPKPRD